MIALREWFTAAELAEFKLPGIPETKRGVNMMAERGGWTSRARAGRGGGLEFHRISLPFDARRALDLHLAAELLKAPAVANTNAPPQPLSGRTPGVAAEAADKTSAPSAAGDSKRDSLWRVYERKPAKAKEEAERRLQILAAIEALIADGRPRGRAIETLAAQSGEHAATLRRWRSIVQPIDRADWLPALAPAHTGRVATAECSPEAWDLFVADYLRNARPTAESCYERTLRIAEPKGWTLPSLKTLMRRLERDVPPAAIKMAREGAEAAARMYPAQERNRAVFKALEAVVADGHKFDVFTRWEDGTIGRPMGVFFQDLYSGKLLAYRIGRAESADLVRLALGDLVEAHGIPDQCWLDNGRAFASKMISGGTANRYRFKVKAEDPQGVLTLLGVQVHWATPYHGQAKPIERAFRDLADRVSRHPAFEGAYTGNSPMNKPSNYGTAAAPIATFLQVLEDEIRFHNARQGRQSAVCAGRSFDEVYSEGLAAALVRRATAEQRRLFLLAAEGVTASKVDGSVSLFGNRYWSGDVALAKAAGSKIVARFDPDKLSDPIHVYTLDGRFIATLPQVERVAFNDAASAKSHAQATRAALRTAKAALDAERRLSVEEVAAMQIHAEEPEAPAPTVVRGVFKDTLKPRPKRMSQEERDAKFGAFVAKAGGTTGL